MVLPYKVNSQLWRGFVCSPVAVFSSSPSQRLGVPCTGASPPWTLMYMEGQL